MRTLIISDLHLGMSKGNDVLRQPSALEPLLAELKDADRLVLLGDVRRDGIRDSRGGQTDSAEDRRRATGSRDRGDLPRQSRPRVDRTVPGTWGWGTRA